MSNANEGQLDVLVRHVAVNTWAGRREYAVDVVGETKTRYRVRARQDMSLPGNRYFYEGQVFLVPKSAVSKPTQRAEPFTYGGRIYSYVSNTNLSGAASASARKTCSAGGNL
jgi:hypothetical protein